MKAYAISLLLEHGFRAGDLADFAKKGGGEAAHRVCGGGAGDTWGPGQLTGGGFKHGLKGQLEDGRLADASSGIIM